MEPEGGSQLCCTRRVCPSVRTDDDDNGTSEHTAPTTELISDGASNPRTCKPTNSIWVNAPESFSMTIRSRGIKGTTHR